MSTVFENRAKLIWLLLSYGGLTLAFALSRLPFLISYHLPQVAPDTASYHYIAQCLADGVWPSFYARTPGYPFLMALSYWLFGAVYPLLLLQALASFAGAALFTFAVQKVRWWLAPLAVAGLVIGLLNPLRTYDDWMMLTESLYASCIVISVAFLILGFVKRKAWLFLLASFFAGYTVYVRPAGIFLVAPFLLVGIFLLINKYGLKNFLAFLLPFPILVFSLMTYNSIHSKKFTLVPLSSHWQSLTTSTYWSTSKDFPESVNRSIEKWRADIPAEHKKVLSTWDFEKLWHVFVQYNVKAEHNAGKLWKDVPRPEYLAMLGKITRNAIKKHPDMYLKFILTHMYYFLFTGFYYGGDIYAALPNMYDTIYIKKLYGYDHKILKEYGDPPHSDYVVEEKNGVRKARLIPNQIMRIHSQLSRGFVPVFNRPVWIYLMAASGLLALLVLVFKKGRSLGAMVVLLLISVHLCAGLVVALGNGAMPRYVRPTEMFVFLTVFLAPMCFVHGPAGNKEETVSE